MALNITRALCGRISNNGLAFQVAGLVKSPEYLVRQISIRSVAPPKSDDTNHDVKNAALGRPMSPHISIYKFPFPSVLSITHRATGIALTAYMTAFGMGALFLPHDFSYYVDMVESLKLSASCLVAIKFTIAYPFTYHLANGIRHLVWDSGKLLNMKEVYTTGYAMLGTSAALAAILAIM